MLTIALCDDEVHQRLALETLVREYLQARPLLQGQVTTFADGQTLLEQVQAQGGFDLYLMDIIMPGRSGVDTGTRLRDMGDDGEIIFLTLSNDYAAESYGVGAFYYLLKPVEREQLFAVLDRAADKLLRRRKEGIMVATRGGSRYLLLEHILYVERVGRFMRYYCTDGTVDSLTIRMAFREMAAPLLADARFYLCGASFVLNFQHVVGVQERAALLDNGRQVLLPRAAAAAFKNAWGKYWLEVKH